VVDRLLGRREDAASPPAEPAAPVDRKAEVWGRVQLARNLRRPRILELLEAMADEFIELHGDRLFGDDEAIVAGLATIGGHRVAVIGQQKGADTEENVRRNFGMPHPEGYRKAMRIMELAERSGLPIVTFVDVPGAHPGPESEERGIAEAIARSVGLMTRLRTPIVTVITGEGGSGGALAIAVGDVVLALENAVYSVISPEGCASILWRTTDEAATAALAMRMTAQDQRELGIVDEVIPEPAEGAHADPAETARRLKAAILRELDRLAAIPTDALVEQRYRRYRALGPYGEVVAPAQEPPPPSRPGLADRLRGLIEAGRGAIPAPLTVGRRQDPPAAEDE
jgi:acetyl-CoA carboxylase carboxyl transferase subunit alpha